ncbi:MAG: redox-sensing transcriptional repressor Rex [Thermoleophilia bacterium]
MDDQTPADGSGTGLPGGDRDPGAAPGGHRPISRYTIERLSVYRRTLEELSDEGVEFVFSHQLAKQAGVSAAQLRRDLASFGSFGNVARGYNVREMDRTIGRIIGTDVPQTIALFGLGDLGRALLSYRGFEERGFNIVAVFETDPEKVGRIFAGRRCYGLESIETVIPQLDIHIAILASRPKGLQSLVDRAACIGVRSFLNFVPKRVNTPPNCFVEHIDISSKLEKLSFLSRHNDRPKHKT